MKFTIIYITPIGAGRYMTYVPAFKYVEGKDYEDVYAQYIKDYDIQYVFESHPAQLMGEDNIMDR